MVKKKVNKTESTQDRIIKKLLDHDEQFNLIRKEMKEMKGDILTVLDQILVIVKRVDQERVFTFAAVQRIQSELEHQQKEIKKIKQVLNI